MPMRRTAHSSYPLYRRLLHREHAGPRAVDRQRAFMRGKGCVGEDPLSTCSKYLRPPVGETWPNGASGTGNRTPSDQLADALHEVLMEDPRAWPAVRAIVADFAAQFYLDVSPMGSLHRLGTVTEIASRVSAEGGDVLAALFRALDPDSDAGATVSRSEAIDGLREIAEFRVALNDLQTRLRQIADGQEATAA